MSDDVTRLKKIASRIKKDTKIKDEVKINELAVAVDDFAKLIMGVYLQENK